MFDKKRAEAAIKEFLIAMGQDVNREGLKETPKRYTKFFVDFLTSEPVKYTKFDAQNYDRPVIMSDISFNSLCEHHLLPINGTVSIGYIPAKGGKIVGISKLARTVDTFASRLQNQERMTNAIGKKIKHELNPAGIIVIAKARHMCVEMRGVKKSCANTVTSYIDGDFHNYGLRNEFSSLIK